MKEIGMFGERNGIVNGGIGKKKCKIKQKSERKIV